MIKTQLSPLPTPSPSISPLSTRSPSPPTGQIKISFANFNFKISKIQPSCFLLPSKPAFLLYPTLNFLLSLFPSHSQLKIFNFSHFTFKIVLHVKNSTFSNLSQLPSLLLSLTLKNLTRRPPLSNTQPHPSLPTTLPHFQIQRHPTFSLSIFLPPHRYILKVRAFHTFYKVAPFRPPNSRNSVGTISKNLKTSPKISCDSQTKTKTFFFSDELFSL
jgi:hypothetical protein